MLKGLVSGIVIIVVIVVAVAEYRFDWPISLSPEQSSGYGNTAGRQPGSTDVPRYSNVRGLQDAPRDDVAEGTVFDKQHCLSTMNLRGLKPAEAQHTCDMLIAGISR